MQRIAYALGVFVLLVASLTPVSVTAQEDSLQVVASFSILADVVQNVAGDRAEVTSLMPLGTDPHAFQPTPQEVASLAEADVVFINGANFEESLMEIIENAGEDMNIAVASQCIEILSGEHDHEEDEEHSEESHSEEMADSDLAVLCDAHYAELAALHGNEAADHAHEEGEEHAHAEKMGRLYAVECGHEEEEEESEGEHEHGACDPHVWTDPDNVVLWTLFIRDTLSALDPEGAEAYAANAAAYIEQLEALKHEELEPLLAAIPEENRVLVTNHETLGYFAATFDFEIAGAVIPGGSTLAEPSAGEIAALIELILDEGITAVFAENTVSADLAQQVVDETGAEFYTLYSDSLSAEGEPASTYLDYMRSNAQTIATALSGE